MADKKQGRTGSSNGSSNSAIEILKLKKDLAQANKKAEVYRDTLGSALRDVRIKGMSKDEINKHYDADNPMAIQEAINNHTAGIDKDIKAMLAEADGKVKSYMDKEFDDTKIDIQSSLASWNAENNESLTYDQLTKDIPPRIMKAFEAGEIATKEELFTSAKGYLEKVGDYNPTTPPAAGKDTPAGAGDKAKEQQNAEEEEEVYY